MIAVSAQSFEQKQMLCSYMESKTGIPFDPRMVQGFAVMNDKNIFVAGVLISNVRDHAGKPLDCEISCATDKAGVPWRPEVCRAVFGYIFNQLGCVRCTSIVKKNNTKSRDFLTALNFVLEGNVRKGYDGTKDALIYGLLREDCAFVENDHG